MPTLRDITCDVYIDGKPAEKYSQTSVGGKHETYIVAEENKPYTVNLQFGRTGAPSHCVWIRSDGQAVNSASCHGPKLEVAGSRYRLSTNRGQPAWEYRHLVFKNISKIGDSASLENRKERIENVGIISVQVRRQYGPLKVIEEGAMTDPDTFRTFSPLKAIPKKEAELRHISHGTHISQKVSEFYDATKTAIPIDVEEHNYVVFNFKYASREMLRQMGVLPLEQISIDDDLVGMGIDSLQQEIMKLRRKSKFGWAWLRKCKVGNHVRVSSPTEKYAEENVNSYSDPVNGLKRRSSENEVKTRKMKQLLCF
ncbi:hypothetical protein TWF730_004534 [Orbilia blumenaviensis]|uniref:DUF7918 domain-containing protein n=1 Tax=Orbilia blumenaviensis TaxID=1796055 RepID=A0AAV9U0T8_9PEZI